MDQNDSSISRPGNIRRRTFIKRTAATVLVFGIGAYAYGGNGNTGPISGCNGSKGSGGSGKSGAANTGDCTITPVTGSECGESSACLKVSGAAGQNEAMTCVGSAGGWGSVSGATTPDGWGGNGTGGNKDAYCVKMTSTPTVPPKPA